MKIWVILILLCAGVAIAADATSQPASSAPAAANGVSSRPAGRFTRNGNRNSSRTNRISATPNMPTTFEEVAARNIFVRGQQRFIPSPPAATTGGGSYVALPNQMLLTGVSLTDNGKVAFLEDQQANLVSVVKVGDKISTGKVAGMTLDSLDYQDANGKTIRVEVGFNLAGGDVWGISSNSSPSTQASTQPARTGPRAPGESMEDYLRRRRAAEAGR